MLAPGSTDCVVVGAGPAGLTAALYLRRYLRDVVVADDGHSRALSIGWSHNYPAFPGGIAGHGLLQRLREQLTGVEGEVTSGHVSRVEHHPDGGFATVCGDHVWRSPTVLLATGVVDAVPALAGIDQVRQRGLLRQCPICDGYEHRGQRILVLGDGPHAAREAAFIADYSPHARLAGLAAVGADAEAPILPDADPASARSGTGPVPMSSWAQSLSMTPDGGLRLCMADGSTHEFDVAYAAMRVRPRSQLGEALGAEVDDDGNLAVDSKGATRVHGLYAAGDVVPGLDQMAVATGQGAIAATAIHQWLRAAAG